MAPVSSFVCYCNVVGIGEKRRSEYMPVTVLVLALHLKIDLQKCPQVVAP